MIQASTRFVPHILVLLGLVGIPASLHHAGLYEVEDCADSPALMASANGAAPPAERVRRFTHFWGEGNWGYGTIPLAEDAGEIEYVIVRSFDPKSVYHRPEARLIGRMDRRRSETLPGADRPLPIERAVAERASPSGPTRAFASYLLVYNGEPVSNPYWSQLVSAPLQFVAGRRPMWLFLAFGEVRLKHREAAEEAARDWLQASWQRYRTVCDPG